MSQEINNTAFNFGNLLENAEEVTLQEYLETYKSRITQERDSIRSKWRNLSCRRNYSKRNV